MTQNNNVTNDTERDNLDHVAGHLEEYYTVRDDGVAHFEGLEAGKYALVRFDENSPDTETERPEQSNSEVTQRDNNPNGMARSRNVEFHEMECISCEVIDEHRVEKFPDDGYVRVQCGCCQFDRKESLSSFETSTTENDPDSCTIVGCNRDAAVTVLFSPKRRIPSDSSPACIRVRGDAIAIDTCLQCRRALDFGNSRDRLVNEWKSEQQKKKFIEQSQVIFSPIESESKIEAQNETEQ